MKAEWAGGTRHGRGGGGGRLQIQLSGQMVWPRNVSFLEVLLHPLHPDNYYHKMPLKHVRTYLCEWQKVGPKLPVVGLVASC